MHETVKWWSALDRRRRVLAAVVVAGAMGLVLLGEITSEPWPFVLAALVTVPYGLVAFVAMYPAFAVARLVVDLVTTASGADDDRLTQVVATPLSMAVFGAAAIASLRLFERWTSSTRRGDS